jgi:putative hydrolase of the HAD superfamily
VLRYVFVDVGNTLTFADTSQTLAPLLHVGFFPSREQLHAAERAAKLHVDEAIAAAPGARVDHDYWETYYGKLASALGAPQAMVPALVAATRVSGRWNQVVPGTRELLEDLHRRGHRLGVISNADGHIAELLDAIGLGHIFDSVTDSGVVGHEKPHPAIFRAALDSLGATPDSSAYVGDIYSIDYLGARAAGMQAILMDVCGAYRDRALPRIEALSELPALV